MSAISSMLATRQDAEPEAVSRPPPPVHRRGRHGRQLTRAALPARHRPQRPLGRKPARGGRQHDLCRARVPRRVHCLLLVPRVAHHPGHRPPLRRPVAAQVGAGAALPELHGVGHGHDPVDVLGLLAGLLQDGGPLHRRPEQLSAARRHVGPVGRQRQPPRHPVLLLPAAVLRVHRADPGGRRL